MPNDSLRARSISAFFWGGAGSCLRLLIQVGAQIVLARLLGPEQYGLFALGVIVISFSNFFSDVGIAYGLIQRERVTAEDIRFVFTWQLILGAMVTALVAVSAGPIAYFFNEPRAQAIIMALAPLCFVQAATAVSLNLLKRELNFRAAQIAQIAGYIVGYIAIGIPMALAGWQVWALVTAWIVQVLVAFVLFYAQVRHPARLMLGNPCAREIVGFGFKVLSTNFVNWVIGNIDRVVVARFMPSTSVGLYATSYNLMYMPSTTVMGVLQPVMYAACARVQGENERIAKAYLALVAAITVGLMPVFFSIAAVSETFVLSLYGPSWAGAGNVLQPLALAMPFLLLWSITTPPLWTNGQPGLEFKLQIPLALVWLAVSLLAVQYTLSAVAWAICGLHFVRSLVFAVAANRITRVTARELLGAAKGGVALSLSIGVIAWAVDRLSHSSGIESEVARLPLIVLGCAFSWGLAVKAFPGIIHPELATLICQGVSRMPPMLAAGASWFFAGAYRK